MPITRLTTRLVSRVAVALGGLILLASIPDGQAALDASAAPQVTIFPGNLDEPRDEGRVGTVWVVNRDRGELTIFDARSGDVLKRISVGAGAHDLCISERAGKAYITAETINTVTTVDTTTLAVGTIAVGPLPHHVEPSYDGRLVYVSLASHTSTVGAPQVAVIDTADGSVTYMTTNANPLARSHGPHPSFDGETLYVAHDIGNAVTAVNTESGTIDLTVGPILRAEEVMPTRFGHLLWATSRGDNTVKRIDLDTGTITASVPVGGVQPESVLLTPSERTLIASLRGTPASLAFVDTVDLTLRGTVPIAGEGTAGDLAVITPNGRFIYATFDKGITGTGGVAVVDVLTGTVVDSWAYPDIGRPHGVWYSRKMLR
jgi:DNA-binding beta-propeller fold protein YncE